MHRSRLLPWVVLRVHNRMGARLRPAARPGAGIGLSRDILQISLLRPLWPRAARTASLFARILLGTLSLTAAVLPSFADGKSNSLAVGHAFGPFTIKVEIEGVTQGVFRSVEGLASESEVLVEPSDSLGVPLPGSQAPGASRHPRLVLKRPFDPLLIGLWRWRQTVAEGNPQKRDGNIFVFNASGMLVAHWVFHEGWPSRWAVPQLLADSMEPAEEIVEIVHTGLTLEPGAGS